MSVFEHPSNGYREKAGSVLSWLWCLLFGGLYLVANGFFGLFGAWVLILMATAAIHPGVAAFVGFVMNLLFAMSIYDMYEKKYLRMGWRKVREDGKADDGKDEDGFMVGLKKVLYGDEPMPDGVTPLKTQERGWKLGIPPDDA